MTAISGAMEPADSIPPAHPAEPPQPRRPASPSVAASAKLISRRHLRFGWWSLLVFLTLGVLLESFHGFKVGWYLDASNETRRLMWTLAHAHGTLLSLVHIAFGLTVRVLRRWDSQACFFASSCLIAASVTIPAGFFMGGVTLYSGDPGLGILLVPVGALFLFISVLLTALGFRVKARG